MFIEDDSKPLSEENIRRLTDTHLSRYVARLDAANRGVPGYRKAELEHYIRLWRGVALKEFKWSRLSEDERQEVLDAVESGE